MILLWARLAIADPVDALDPSAQPFFLKAEADAEAGKPGQAILLYRMVLQQDPAFVPAQLGLARALLATGDTAGAISVYLAMGDEPEAVEAVAQLIEPTDPVGARRLWKRLQTLRLGDPVPYGQEARLLAATDPAAAMASWRMYTTLLQGAEPDARVFTAIVEATPDKAEEMLRAYVDAFPDAEYAAEARSRLDRMDIERAAAELELGGDVPLDAAGDVEVAAAEQALAAGKVEEARGRAEALVARAPRSGAAHGVYADALEAQGMWSEAETQARLARQLRPDDARARARLGWLLHRAYGGREDDEAAVELRAAVRLRPGEAELRARAGRVEQALGEFDAAIEAYEAYLQLTPDGKEAADLRERLDALRRQAPPVPPPVPSADLALPAEAQIHFRVCRVLLGKGRREEARVELEQALAIAPQSTLLLNERARLDREDGDLAAAIRGWKQSVALDPAQADVWRNLGDAATDRDERRRCFEEAATEGDVDAHYLLAEIAFQDGDWEGVRRELGAYELRASAASYYREAAQVLRAEADRRYYGLRVGIAATLGLAALIPALVWFRRRTASTLRDLLDGAPESWHDAARLLAALRHEVLKHNTTVLPDVADALARHEIAPWETFAARAGDLRARFDDAVAALEALGRRHGRRLDLVHRDPIFKPMARAMARLDSLARGRRPPAPADLFALSRVLNVDGYAAVGRIVQQICVLPVAPGLIREVYQRVAGEPGFAGAPLPEIEVEDGPAQLVRMFRSDLEDILANLLRNALAAGASRVGGSIRTDEDPVTGHELVELRIWDDAPGQLTNAMIRGRYIARGLGLAVDLTNRHGGAIRVEPMADGRKAIVVQFRAVEAAPMEGEWSVS